LVVKKKANHNRRAANNTNNNEDELLNEEDGQTVATTALDRKRSSRKVSAANRVKQLITLKHLSSEPDLIAAAVADNKNTTTMAQDLNNALDTDLSIDDHHTETTKLNTAATTTMTTNGSEMRFYRKRDNNEETLVINVNSKLGKYVRQRQQIVGMLVTLITVLYICLFPLRIWNLALIFFGESPTFTRYIGLREYWYIQITVRILFYLNSSINPILYNWFSKKFRRTFRRAVRLPKCLPKFMHMSTPVSTNVNNVNNNNNNNNNETQNNPQRNVIK
jgi:hypothetical protein